MMLAALLVAISPPEIAAVQRLCESLACTCKCLCNSGSCQRLQDEGTSYEVNEGDTLTGPEK